MTPPVRQRPLPPPRTARFGHGGVSTGAATFLGSPLVIALLRLRGSGHGGDSNHIASLVELAAPARKIHRAHPMRVAEQVACNDTTGIGWDRQITCHTGVLGYGSIPPNRVLGSIFRHNMTGAKTGTTSGLGM